MEVRTVPGGALLTTQAYSAFYDPNHPLHIQILVDRTPIFHLPLISGLSSLNEDEELSGFITRAIFKPAEEGTEIEIRASSSLWQERAFRMTFFEDRIEYQHWAKGHGPLGRCFFFSNDPDRGFPHDSIPNVFCNANVYADQYFKPSPNHGDQWYRTVAQRSSLGIYAEHQAHGGFLEAEDSRLFCPPPFCLPFHREGRWVAICLGEEPGRYLFNGFEYSGVRFHGASFYVNYMGYRTLEGEFSSPRVCITFGHSEWETLEKYVAWSDSNGFSTQRAHPNASWHRMPVFCGWAEQTTQCQALGKRASDLASQSFYEKWVGELEARDLPFGTIVIDDKWQKHYGTFLVDPAKWPDMKAFVDAQHQKNRRVLLWLASYHTEGLPKELCLLDEGHPIAADVTHPEYESLLRKQIGFLVRDIGIDGFKVDWQCGCFKKAGLRPHAPITGIEFLRRFQFLIYDETHRWKPDALVESHNCHPLFRDVIDGYRLGDIWFGTRDIPGLMRVRAKIARIVGWDVVDCDNGSQTYPDEWFNYMKAQPQIGVPSLYALHLTESTFEELPEYMFRHIADLWRRYIRENV